MRKIALILSLACAVVVPALAQQDKRAQGILDAMSNHYKSLKSYQASFTYGSPGENNKGNLTVKGNRFRLLVSGQDVFSDGKTMSTYSHETNELNVQDYDASSQGDMNPTQIYSLYKRGYTYQFVKEQKQGSQTFQIIDLTPTDTKQNIKSVQLSINKTDKSIRKWLITSKYGKRTTYTITKFVPNASVQDSYFMFDKSGHPGVEVVDLR